MRIIITGGTGLIGRFLVANLVNDGHDVIVLSRSPEKVSGLPGSVGIEKWDGKTVEGWGALIDGADAIVNLAGASIGGEGFFPAHWTDERKALIRDSRVNAGQALVEAIKQSSHKPGALVQMSAVGYYGEKAYDPVTEDSPPGKDFIAQVVVEWEKSTEPVEQMGVRRVILRSGVVFTPDGGVLSRMALPFKLFVGGPIGSGKQPVPWVHIHDLVAVIRYLIDNPDASGVYNVTASGVVTYGQFAKVIGKVLGRPSFMPLPGFVMYLMFGEVAQLVVHGQNVVPKRLQDAGFTFHHPELEPALRDLYDR